MKIKNLTGLEINCAIGGLIIKKIEFKISPVGVLTNFLGESTWYGDDYLVAAMCYIIALKFGKKLKLQRIF